MGNNLVVKEADTGIVENTNTATLFNSWIEYLDASPKTIETYTRAIRQFYKYINERGIEQPTREDIKAYRDYIISTHKPSTTQAYITALKQFYNWAEDNGYYPNIARRVKGAKLDPTHKKDYLTTPQIKEILGNIDRTTLKGKRDYALITLMATAGVRTIEIVRANVEDIKPVNNFTALFLQGKGHQEKADYVKITPQVEKAIREYLTARGDLDASAPLFESVGNKNKAGRLTTKTISRSIKEAFITAGYNSDRLTAHSLRHTTATLNLLNGGTLEETRQLMRHTNINTTLIYSHALERANNCSEDRIASVIFG